jgi:1-deoxy-D-xylulose-5-phosphate reductoisomerase
MKRIVLLGSTGSIGTSALRVVEQFPDRLSLVGLAVNSDYRAVLEQAKRFNVKHVAVADEAAAKRCQAEAAPGIRVYSGAAGVEALAALDESDIVLCAIVGMAGLRPVLAALKRGCDVALATKEVLVAAGAIVTETCRATGSRLLPVDSEHSAVFQCIEGRRDQLKRIILTASGGPFAFKPAIDFETVTVGEALKHPRWNMGRKVTVDSATLINKGLEIMEARWMFDWPLDKIDVIIHPESIVHSLVELVDGSVLGQFSPPDMRFAIQYALTWPERYEGDLPALDLARLGTLKFAAPDERRFPGLTLAREAARTGGTMPAVLNAANEIAVQRFLDGTIPFAGIWRLVERLMRAHAVLQSPTLDQIIEADNWARIRAGEIK